MDRILLAIVLVFLCVLSEYPLLFPVQEIPMPAISHLAAPALNMTPYPSNQTAVQTAVINPVPVTLPAPAPVPACSKTPPSKILKDSRLWFTVTVPEDWNATSAWEAGGGTWQGLYFYTYLGVEEFDTNRSIWRINSTKIFIMTYTITRNQDQDYRNYYRGNWVPVPVESTETINGITFDRFESKGQGTAVAYVGKKTSANGRGYATLIRYFVSQDECQEDIEEVVHTFRYLSSREIALGNVTANEISLFYP
ncbi:MAG: hypothetical protein OS112_01350 [Methanoregula sp.]|nr:MAG: hypothetical protein OS112_01350 [Methanoregula sp.]